jgi:hypothetical protein
MSVEMAEQMRVVLQRKAQENRNNETQIGPSKVIFFLPSFLSFPFFFFCSSGTKPPGDGTDPIVKASVSQGHPTFRSQ